MNLQINTLCHLCNELKLRVLHFHVFTKIFNSFAIPPGTKQETRKISGKTVVGITASLLHVSFGAFDTCLVSEFKVIKPELDGQILLSHIDTIVLIVTDIYLYPTYLLI